MQRLSSLDASFLYLETPTVHMHVGLVLILDPGASPQLEFSRIVALAEQKARATPLLCKRLVEVPLQLEHPLWIDDPHFDFFRHFRRDTCPGPGDMAALSTLVERIISTPLERSRPLWELWLVEGLEQGRFALVAKIHHAIADGMAGSALLSSLLSVSPEDFASSPGVKESSAAEAVPNPYELVREAVASRLRNLRRFTHTWKHTYEGVMTVRHRRRSAGHHVGAKLFDAPRTRWNAPITGQRTTAFARVPLADLDAIRRKTGGSRNDVILALCSGTVRRYLEARGELPLAPLIATCPTSSRKRGKSGNQISAIFTSLATHLEDPIERLQAIRNMTRGAKEEHSAIGGDLLSSWAELVSPAVFSLVAQAYTRYRIAGWHPPMYNVAISNVPGPKVPVYFGGARLVAVYPTAPVIEGGGLNITVMSYLDQAYFGFVAAASLLPDLSQLAEGVAQSRDELLRAVGRN